MSDSDLDSDLAAAAARVTLTHIRYFVLQHFVKCWPERTDDWTISQAFTISDEREHEDDDDRCVTVVCRRCGESQDYYISDDEWYHDSAD